MAAAPATPADTEERRDERGDPAYALLQAFDPLSEQLLRTMADTLDVRQVFMEVSDLAIRMVPCDRFTLSFDDGRGHVAGGFAAR